MIAAGYSLPMDTFECMTAEVNDSTGRQRNHADNSFTDTFGEKTTK